VKTQVEEFIRATLDKKNRIVAVIGVCKNAGKTTLMNWLLQQAEEDVLGVLTTGRDGEDIDLVTHEAKPKVGLPAHSIFSTFAEEIEKHASNLAVLEKLPLKAGGRNLWLAKAKKELRVEIVGPASAEAQLKLAKHLLSLGATKVFIDGSLDRKAISLQEGLDAVVLVISPAFGDEIAILDEVVRLHELSTIKQSRLKFKSDYISYRTSQGTWKETEYKSLLSREKEIFQHLDMEFDSLYLPCPITDKGFPIIKSFLQQYKGELILRHPYLLHISLNHLNWLKKNSQLKVISPFKLKAIAVNSYASNGKHLPSDALRTLIRQRISKLPIIDVKEII